MDLLIDLSEDGHFGKEYHENVIEPELEKEVDKEIEKLQANKE